MVKNNNHMLKVQWKVWDTNSGAYNNIVMDTLETNKEDQEEMDGRSAVNGIFTEKLATVNW